MSRTLALSDDPATRRVTARPFRSLHQIAVVGVFGIALALAACSPGGGTTSNSTIAGSGSSGATGQAITIKNFAFSPSSITVAPGTSVTVTNRDSVAHTLSSQSGGFDTGNIQAGQSKTFMAPNKAGRFTFICDIHQYMTGTLNVS
jgi:plastocyanin